MRTQIRNLAGKRFGKLIVLRFAAAIGRDVYWDCLCDCGNIITTCRHYLTRKRNPIRHCGCKRWPARRNPYKVKVNQIENILMVEPGGDLKEALREIIES